MLRQTLMHVFAAAPLLGLAWAGVTQAETPPKISGPHTHENLSIYFIHGKSADGQVPLTLEEALAKGLVEVRETDTVSQLIVENKGKEEVFVHAGDIVKGGKQDRVVTASFVLPGHSKPTDVPVYCVEAGRWAPRGQEDSRKFSVAAEMLPTKEAKLAMMAAPSAAATGALRRAEAVFDPEAEPQQRREPPRNTRVIEGEPQQREVGGQGEVWRNVAEIQQKLSAKLKTTVKSTCRSRACSLRSSIRISPRSRNASSRLCRVPARLKAMSSATLSRSTARSRPPTSMPPTRCSASFGRACSRRPQPRRSAPRK